MRGRRGHRQKTLIPHSRRHASSALPMKNSSFGNDANVQSYIGDESVASADSTAIKSHLVRYQRLRQVLVAIGANPASRTPKATGVIAPARFF